MRLRIELLSDSAFGRGDGVAGLVDSEVEHDARTGLPFIKGRTVKGLLVEACADLLYALDIQKSPASKDYHQAAWKLFGRPGSTLADKGCLHVGAALLPDDFRQHILAQVSQKTPTYTAAQMLQAFTTIRHQTAVDTTTDMPKEGSLRSIRVVLRGTVFEAALHSDAPLKDSDYQLLAACAAGVKWGGQNRTRGLGQLKVELIDIFGDHLAGFIRQIGGAA